MLPPRYPSALSDEEWAIFEPLLSRAERRGRPPKWPYLAHVHPGSCEDKEHPDVPEGKSHTTIAMNTVTRSRATPTSKRRTMKPPLRRPSTP
jgi:hypothetical protein